MDTGLISSTFRGGESPQGNRFGQNREHSNEMKPDTRALLFAALLISSLGLARPALCAADAPIGGGFPLKLGDLDGDGRATVLDLVRMANHLNGAVPLSSDLLLFADVNQDGSVDNSDLTAIANAILGLTP